MTCVLDGVKFDNVTMAEAVTTVISFAQKSEKPCFVCTANLDHLANMRHDSEFRRIYSIADLVVADGMPLVWLSKLAGAPLKERVAGSDMFWELGKASSQHKLRLFLLGGLPGSADAAARKLEECYPGAVIAGTYCPPFGNLDTNAEDAKIMQMLAESRPDILMVGLGAPKQEKWIAAHIERFHIPVSIGVGASFDMAAGMVKRAPVWMQKTGLEWMFRLIQEPARLWNRYILRDIPYLISAAITTIRMRSENQKSIGAPIP
jgi:N-acetylglucosaminyldiphosphoundecaprenol N-acetyl-beta-D-mannosaminyltransferase